MNQLNATAPLPAIRAELKILPGIREINGLKTWLIFDPVRHEYFQIDEKSHEILRNWSTGTAATIKSVAKNKNITIEDVESLLRFLWINSLTVKPPNNDLGYYVNHKLNSKAHWFIRLLHGYLFFVIPLLRPDKILRKTEPFTRFFFTRYWLFAMLLIGVIALYLTSRQWDQFLHTFNHFFSYQGMLYYALALVFTKLAHEAGHAYAATRYGCCVKSMGLGFIVMFPVLYTDTTDSWKLTSKSQRLVICGAGVAVELSLAVIATFVWAFADDGPLRSVAFFVATTSWVMTLFINMNPLMRFDAYHFLSDALGVQNLQSRSFALGRWSMREWLFRVREIAPEAMPVRWVRGLTLFAWATWVYRFFLFLGIAIVVHQMFFQPVGTILAIVEVTFFIAIPIFREINQWYSRRDKIMSSSRAWVTGGCVAAFLVFLVLPWQTTVRIPAVLEPEHSVEIYAPADARLLDISVSQGDHVQVGQELISLKSDIIDNQITLVKRQVHLREALLNRVAADTTDLEQRIVLESELRSYKEELDGLKKTNARLVITAPFSGLVGTMGNELHPDRWAGEGQYLLTLNSPDGARVRGFVERDNVGRISEGSEAVFVPEVPELETLTGKLSLVEAANAEHLNIEALASHYGGSIASNVVDSEIVPLKAWYHINVELPGYNTSVDQQRRGVVLTQGRRESIAMRIWRRIFYVVLREMVI